MQDRVDHAFHLSEILQSHVVRLPGPRKRLGVLLGGRHGHRRDPAGFRVTVSTLAAYDVELGHAFALLGPRGRVGQTQHLAGGFVRILGKAQIRWLIIRGGVRRGHLLVLQVQGGEIIDMELLLVFVGRKRIVFRFPVHVPGGVLGRLLVVEVVLGVSVEAVEVRGGVEVCQEAGHVRVGECPFL